MLLLHNYKRVNDDQYFKYFLFYSDFNFERLNIDSPCIPVRGYDPYAVPKNCTEGAFYTVSSG